MFKKNPVKKLLQYKTGKKIKILLLLLILLTPLFITTIWLGIYRQVGNVPNSKKAATEAFLDEAAQKVVNRCRNDSGWRNCYGEQISLLNPGLDFPDTLKILAKVEEIDPKTRDCHLIAHWIATSEVEKNPDKWIDIFNYVDQTTCVNGFVHGVLEGRSRSDPAFVIDQNTLPQVCKQIEEKTSSRIGEVREKADEACGHVMGHILLAQEEAVMKNAVAVCDKVSGNIRRNCFDGIFMENITRENLEDHRVAQKFAFTKEASIGLEKNCRQYGGEAGRSCWRELVHIYTPLTNNDPEQVYKLCYQSENLDYAKECYMHGINLMILSDDFGRESLAALCKPYFNDESGIKTCIGRSLYPLLGSSVDFIDRAVTFCDAIPEGIREYCYSKIGEIIKPKTSIEKRISLCKNIPDQYSDLCIGEK